MSVEGTDALIKEFEGKELFPYSNDSNSTKNCTVGYGHLLHSGPCSSKERSTKYSEEQIDKFLKEDLSEFEWHVIRMIRVRLTQGQFDALVSLAFNLTGGLGNAETLVNAVNSKDWSGAAKAFELYNKAGGVKSPGLVCKRWAEERWF